jgi:hypothetical protein
MPEIIEDTVIDDLEWDYWPCQEEIYDIKDVGDIIVSAFHFIALIS